MLFQCGLLLMFISFVRTKESVYDYRLDNVATEYDLRYSYWPSVHNALVKFQKREAVPGVAGANEGGGTVTIGLNPSNAVHSDNPSNPNNLNNPSIPNSPSIPANPDNLSNPSNPNNHPVTPPPVPIPSAASDDKNQQKTNKIEPTTSIDTPNNHTALINETHTIANATTLVTKQLDLQNPGVLMRGIIVFGGFLLLAVAYYVFYRKKGNDNDMGNNHNSNDTNQFRYGVLQSDDRRDNLELSRVPLTMESDDDEDEDLEIFDLEQKKKSLSYVNLQTNDEDIVFPNTKDGNDKDNLLLDIEDAASDTLINWSSTGNNKSIL